MKKNRGFSLLEVIFTLGLLSIFSALIFPLLKISNDLSTSLMNQSLFEKDTVKLLSLIEKSIDNSQIAPINYIGKEYLENAAIVLNYNKEIQLGLTEDFFKKKTNRGNTLFLELPTSDGKNIFYFFVIFRFYLGKLQVIECKNYNNIVYVENSNSIADNIHGYFEKTTTGIIINIEILNNNLSKVRSLKGYENFKK